MTDLAAQFGALIAAGAAIASAVFAAATWRLSRSQFQLFWPFVEVNYRRLLNGHLIEFSKAGQQCAEWELTHVSIKGGNCSLANFRTISMPEAGIGWAGQIQTAGRKLTSPTSSFLIVNEEGPLEVKLIFVFQAKSRARLRHRVCHRLSLQSLPPGSGKGSSENKLFSGQIEVKF